MGTHPIFESDFDCLTDVMGKSRRQPKKTKPGGGGGATQIVKPGASQGLVFNTSGYGQHILKNPQVVQSMVEKAGIQKTDTILEIGPGTGNMTVKLCEAAKKVVAIEVDERMVAEVKKRVMGTPLQRKLEIVQSDALKAEFPFFDLCIANLPYAISSPVTFKLLLHRPAFRCAILMFQKEFADRLCAQPGDKVYSRLTVAVQTLARCDRIMKVGKNNFKPPPINFTEWDAMLRIAFGRKNRTLSAEFNNKKVKEVIEKNYRTHCAINNLAVKMDLNMSELIDVALGEVNMSDSRARQMDIGTKGLTTFLPLCNRFLIFIERKEKEDLDFLMGHL